MTLLDYNSRKSFQLLELQTPTIFIYPPSLSDGCRHRPWSPGGYYGLKAFSLLFDPEGVETWNLEVSPYHSELASSTPTLFTVLLSRFEVVGILRKTDNASPFESRYSV